MFFEFHGVNELRQFLLNVINIVLSRQKIETVNSESLNILSIFNKDFLDSFKSLLPVSINHVNLGLLY